MGRRKGLAVWVCGCLGMAAAVGTNGCWGDDRPPTWIGQTDGPRIMDGGAPARRLASLVTLNAGLVGGEVPLAAARLPLIIDALNQMDADAICLQEVWTDEDATALMNGVSGTYPYVFRALTAAGTTGPRCYDPVAATALQSCVEARCVPAGTSASECVGSLCKSEFDQLTTACKLCLFANADDPLTCVTGGARAYVYDGRNGLLLLSRLPLGSPRYTSLGTEVVEHGVIDAVIGGADVRCTYLTADLSVLPYPEGRTYRSWAEEHAATVRQLVASSADLSWVMLAGDLNCGPAQPGLTAELPSDYQTLTAVFTSPWESPRCTWCKENPLTGSSTDQWIDHVMVRSCPGPCEIQYSRVLDQPVTLQSEGQLRTIRLSDHYGLRVDLR